MGRLPPALVIMVALMVQSAPLCCLADHAAPAGGAHAAGHHGPAPAAEGAFDRSAIECAGTIQSFTGSRARFHPATFEVPAPAIAGPPPGRPSSLPVAPVYQRAGHPPRVGPPPYLPLRV